MKRTIAAVVSGYGIWTAMWLLGNALLFGGAADAVQAGERYARTAPLMGVIVLSVVCSLVAGLATARIAKGRSRNALLVVAALLVATGIGVQAGVWNLMPVWYHLAFLVLLAPMVLTGGRLAASR